MRSVWFFIRGYWAGKRGKYLSRNRLSQRQERLFSRLKSKVLVRSHFYRPFINLSLSAFPVINKQQLLQHFDEINTVGLSRKACEQHALLAEQTRDFSGDLNGIAVGLSSGTSGQRGIFLTNRNEQAEWAGYIIAKNLKFSFKPQRVALLLRSNNALYKASSGKLVQFRFFDLTHRFDTITTGLERFQPDILIAPAQLLGRIANEEVNISPSKIISVAEVLEDEVRQRVEQAYHLPLDEIYQCTEGYIASTCEHGNLHLNEDIMLIEKHWVDEASGRFMPVVTDLRRSSLPIVRFRLDDILQLENEACRCGSAMQRLKKIEGRNDDCLWLKAGDSWQQIFPDIIRRTMMMCSDSYNDYRIEQWGEAWHVSIDSIDFTGASAVIRQALKELAHAQHCEAAEILFKTGIVQSNMEKYRRIACRERSNLGSDA